MREIEGLDFVGAVRAAGHPRRGHAAATPARTREAPAPPGAARRRRRRRPSSGITDGCSSSPDAGAGPGLSADPRHHDGEVRHLQARLGRPTTGITWPRAAASPTTIWSASGLGSRTRPTTSRTTSSAPDPVPDLRRERRSGRLRRPQAPEHEGPKYKNSSTTPSIYDKSRVLYGLNWAKEQVVRADEVVVCEGYTDVIGLRQAGMPRAVATCGTALTEDHVQDSEAVRLAGRVEPSTPTAPGRRRPTSSTSGSSSSTSTSASPRCPPGVDPGDLARTDPDALAAAVEEAPSVPGVPGRPGARRRRPVDRRGSRPGRRGGDGARG